MRMRRFKAIRLIVLAGFFLFGTGKVGARSSIQNSCVNSLRQIDGAKEQLALEKKLADTTVANADALAPYIHGGFPKCPGGGTYTIGSVREDARCSIAEHSVAAIGRRSESNKRVNAILTVGAGVVFVAVVWLVCGAVIVYRRDRKERGVVEGDGGSTKS
jgi:hypothetical protein